MPAPAIRRVIILGAQSAIAEAAARRFAAEGARIVLAGRDQGRLNEIAHDLAARGSQQVHAAALDFQTEPDPQARMREWADRIGGVSHVLIAFGVLGDQAQSESDLKAAQHVIDANFTAASLWALAAANVLEQQATGVLMAIGSVAGDRGRRSNYVYGAAKGALATLMQGLAHRLSAAGDARAVLIKPGFVDTPMTASFKKGPLWSQPDDIAAVIHRAARRSGPVVYAPWYWRYIMLLIRALPAPLMHRTKL